MPPCHPACWSGIWQKVWGDSISLYWSSSLPERIVQHHKEGGPATATTVKPAESSKGLLEPPNKSFLPAWLIPHTQRSCLSLELSACSFQPGYISLSCRVIKRKRKKKLSLSAADKRILSSVELFPYSLPSSSYGQGQGSLNSLKLQSPQLRPVTNVWPQLLTGSIQGHCKYQRQVHRTLITPPASYK